MGEHIFNIYSMTGLIFVVSCYTFPYIFVLVANALDRIPGDLEDASAMLGGRTWTTARRDHHSACACRHCWPAC